MKSRTRLISILSGAAVLLAVAIVLIINAVNTASMRMKPISAEEALQRYAQAKELFSSTADYQLTITTAENRSVDGNIYSVKQDQKLTYKDFGTENMQAALEEIMTIGKKQTVITEVFAENTAYCTVNESTFCSDMTPEIFAAQFAPAAAIDISLYKTVAAEKNKDGVYIRLEDATGPEVWCIPQNGKMRTGSGTILLDSKGNLKETTYNIEYQQGLEIVNLTVTVELETLVDPLILVPDKTKYIPISAPYVPRMLERIYGYLLQANNIFATGTESINCQASGIKHDQKTTLIMENADNNLSASVNSNISIIDYNNGANPTEQSHEEKFQDNVYSISNDGGKTFEQKDVTAQQMLSYCQDYLVKNLILPEYISSVTASEDEENYTLQITGTEELAQLICENACQVLYDNPQLLNDLASSYKTQKITCYYTVGKYSGEPISAGLDYSGEHIIEGFAYTLTYNAQITYGYAMPAEESETLETTETTA